MAEIGEQEIMRRFTATRAKCDKWHKRLEEYERLYDLEHYQGSRAKAGERRITLAKPMNIVDLAVGILTANDLNVQVVASEDEDETRKRASLIEQFLDGVLYVNSERQETDLRYDWTFHQTRDGAVAIRSIWDPSFDRTLQADTFEELPLVVDVIPAKYMFPEPGGKQGRWKWVFYAMERSVSDVEQEYGELDKFRTMNGANKETRKGTFLDYWAEVPTVTEEGVTYEIHNAVLYDGRIIIPPRVMEGYRDIPYTFMFYKPVGKVNPEDWGQSALRPIENLVGELEWRINRQTRMLNVFANMPLVARVRDGRPVKVDAAFGDVVSLGEGEDLAFPQWPGQPPDAKDQMQMVNAEIQEGSFPQSMYGEGPGMASGYAMSQLGDAGRIRLTQPQKQQERALAVWARKTLCLLREFAPDLAVQVYGKLKGVPFNTKLTGNDTEGFRVDFQLKPKFPNDESRKVAMATQTKDTLSSETRMERYLDVQQPDQEVRKVLREQAEQHPAMVEFQMMAEFERLAAQGNKAAQQMLAKMQAEGMSPNKPGPNPQLPKPEQFGGLPTNKPGEVTQQEAGLAPPGQEPLQEQDRLREGVPLT